jgi:hypothetical protein
MTSRDIWSAGNSEDSYSTFNRYREYASIKDVSQWSDLEPLHQGDTPRVFMPSVMTGGDYSGNGLVAQANHDAWRKEFADSEGEAWVSIRGGHGGFAIAIDMTYQGEQFDAMQDFLSGLANYPLADEELHSALEIESQDRAWGESYGVSRDFWRALCHEVFWELDITPEYDDTRLRQYFETLCEKTSTYWVNEQGDQSWIDVKRLTREIDRDAVLACVNLEGWKEIYAEQQSALKRCDEEIDASQEAFGLLVDALADKLGITSQELTRRIENVGCVEAIR